MNKFWYKFEDQSIEGKRRGFAVIVDRAYVEAIKGTIDIQALRKAVASLSASDPNIGNLGLECVMDDETPNLLWSINCPVARYGLDQALNSFLLEDKEKEVVYETHNCVNDSQRTELERAFLKWAEMVEAYNRLA